MILAYKKGVYMEIILGRTAGFCYGVKNAVENVKKELEKQDKLYCLGE